MSIDNGTYLLFISVFTIFGLLFNSNSIYPISYKLFSLSIATTPENPPPSLYPTEQLYILCIFDTSFTFPSTAEFFIRFCIVVYVNVPSSIKNTKYTSFIVCPFHEHFTSTTFLLNPVISDS